MDLSSSDLQALREDDEFGLYRARPPGPSASVLVLVAREASPKTVARLEHEFGLASLLDSRWAARPLEFRGHPSPATLILEDHGCDPLSSAVRLPLEPGRFLRLAVKLATAISQVHGQGLIHKDIKPANVLVDDAGDVRLTGFGVASRLPREPHRLLSPEMIVGSLAYLAPEQTGRMNRSVDSRSDLYAFGMTLYEILTGVLPFAASDAMEWIHCHVARKPTPPGARVSGVPQAIEAIVLKLLAKNAEDRYQTATGAKEDLQRCLRSWEERGYIEPFPLGSSDASDVLRIPEKLYGRERQVASLVSAFERVATSGDPELVVVSGYSGVGKSAFVNELHRAIVPPRALYAAGKFDQYRRGVPYATLAQAFQSLIRELLSKSDQELGRRRKELLEALGPNGALMINLIPELALVIGPQPPVPDLPTQDRQNRFQQVFRRFLGVFARPEHPLALFLDDMQWLDNATIDLIEHVATHPEVRHLLIVGAYRDNEVGSDHPLIRMFAAIRSNGGRVEEISIAPLALTDIQRLLDDALRGGDRQITPLAALVFEKTGGNPFFAIQFLSMLVDQGLLQFDATAARWSWDLARIGARGFTDNVADLMATKLSRLGLSTQNALAQFACLGNVADTATLALTLDGDDDDVHLVLWEAVHAGLVHRMERSYEFLHDRIQEAAYARIDGAERLAAHLRIGRLLTKHTPPADLDSKIFDIVHQYARGAGQIESPEERALVAEFNLRAGTRAKAASAYVSARHYFASGKAILGEEARKQHDRLTFELELNLSECEYVTGDFAAAEERLSTLAARTLSDQDRAAVTRLQIYLHTNLDQSARAVAAGLDYLRHVKNGWSSQPGGDDVRRECERLVDWLNSASGEALLNRPLLDDPDLLATMEVLTALCSPAQFMDLDLFRLVVVRMATLSLEHGYCDATTFAFTLLGGIIRTYLGDAQAGARFGRLALDLIEKRGLSGLSARAYSVFAVHVAPWTEHLSECRTYLQRSFDAARNVGDLTCAAYARVDLVTNLLATGAALADVEAEAESALEFVQGAQFGLISDVIIAQLRLIRTLRGATPEFGVFKDADFDENAFEARLEGDPQLAVAASRYWIRKLQARVYARDFDAARVTAAKAAALLWTLPTQVELPEYHFYAALTLAGCCESADDGERERLLAELNRHLQLFMTWSRSGPENFGHRAALLGAEIARLEKRDLDAMALYEEAISAARDNGFIQNEGLSHELAARFYGDRGFATMADASLRNARACYLLWGADGKVRHLDRSHVRTSHDLGRRAPVAASIAQLDIATIVKMSQAISGQIQLGRLIEALMVAALEHAGAERGLVILPRGQDWHVEAEAKTVGDRIEVDLQRTPVAQTKLAESIFRFVARTKETVSLDDARRAGPFVADEYLAGNQSRSILCLPLVKQTELVGVLYLENALAANVFTPNRVAVLELLASQAAISLENAHLYADLRQSEIYLTEAQRLSHTGSFGWRPSSGEVFWSEQTYSIFGIEPATRPTLDLVLDRTHPDDIPLVKGEIEAAIGENRGFDFEHRLLMPDGSVKQIRVVARAVAVDPAGLTLAGAVIDLTDSIRTQTLLQRLQSDFAHAARISTLGELTASIAHELNQPIAGIILNGQTGLRRLDRPEPDLAGIRASTGRILRDAQRASDIIARIRGMAQRRAPHRSLVRIEDLVEETLVFLRHEIRSFAVSVLEDLTQAASEVLVDRIQLQQVVVNLMVNAMQAIAQAGSADRKITIRTTVLEDRMVRCAVEDSGPGIDPSRAKRLFDSFFTTKQDGMGIGLSVCRSIVEAHGGQIGADNDSIHGGARFYFTLPAADKSS